MYLNMEPAIFVKKIPASNVKGARMSATAMMGDKPLRVYLSYDDALGIEENFLCAVEKVVQKLYGVELWLHDVKKVKLSGGCSGGGGCVFVVSDLIGVPDYFRPTGIELDIK